MTSADRKELILLLWYRQIKEFITNGSKNEWSYKKIKGQYLKTKNRKKDILQIVNQGSISEIRTGNNKTGGNVIELVRIIKCANHEWII